MNAEKAYSRAYQLAEDGADLIDVGAESSRPGAAPVSLELEWRRLCPVLKRLRKNLPEDIKVSVDTYKPELMRRAAAEGVDFINNIRGLADMETLQYLASLEHISYLAMHKKGEPKNMQSAPLEASEAMNEVSSFFLHAHKSLTACGFKQDRIWLDPGIGFGKSDPANLVLMQNTPKFAKKFNLAFGISRKSQIGRLLNLENPADRDAPSKMAEIGLILAGARLVRTHEVASLVRFRNIFSKACL